MALFVDKKIKHFIDVKLSKIIVFAFCIYFVSGDANDYPQKLDWWQTSVIYQIYPRSFKDSNGDGIGDIKGIEEQLPYFQDVGIKSIWISPIFRSPMFDMGYDVSDFKDIDPLFGTMDDFDSLVKKVKELDMKIILDFVPNHSSDESEWFQKSIKRIDPYTDYYVWRDPKGWTDNGRTPVPPNNWICAFQGPAWTYNAERKQFYLHDFSEKQPDLNYRSPALVKEMMDVLRFWLDKGVDGFRMDSVAYLYEHPMFPDEPIISNNTINGYPEYYSALNHTYTMNQPETYTMLAEMRKLLDSYSSQDGQTRLMITEAYTTFNEILRYYGTEENPIAHLPFNFRLLTSLNYTSNSTIYHDIIYDWLDNMPENAWPNWVLGNHDNRRIPTRFSVEMIDGLNMLNLLLPGTPFTWQGEEIGMEDTKIRWDQTQDVQALSVGSKMYESLSRDPERTPFQWSSSIHAGFSQTKGNTWLPVNPNYYNLNVEMQKSEPRSHLSIYKSLLKLRQTEVMQKGDFFMTSLNTFVLAFRRILPGEDIYVVVLNLNNEEEYIYLNTSIKDLPPTMNVIISSGNSEHHDGDTLNTGDIGFKMRPHSALVLQAAAKRDSPLPFYFKSDGSRSSLSTKIFVLALCNIILALWYLH